MLSSMKTEDIETYDTEKYPILKELIDSDNLKKAFIAFYNIPDFLCKNFPDVPLIILTDKKKNKNNLDETINDNYNNVVLKCHYESNMHIKAMFLYYDNFLRIVLCSGNLEEIDWVNTNSISYVQDFPLKEADNIESEKSFEFRKILQDLFNKLEMKYNIPLSFSRYDFSKSEGYLVSSVPGTYSILSDIYYGHPALSTIVKQKKLLKPEAFKDHYVNYMCTALGHLKQSWMGEFRSSAMGYPPKALSKEFHNSFCYRLFFPTTKAVQEMYQRQKTKFSLHFNNLINPMLKNILYSIPVTRMKFLSCLPKELKLSDNFTTLTSGWFYLGSHNFSASAWGKLRMESPTLLSGFPSTVGSKKDINYNQSEENEEFNLVIKNFELGIVFPANKLDKVPKQVLKVFEEASLYNESDLPASVGEFKNENRKDNLNFGYSDNQL
ncbi:hypothetical protein K502DRAFT_245811 [Neoconidiobolus thromboides FSU 785]|nr:hypothetical protein K502DRAFT_245811 [Neoconidiobolus thromboides FSU 785]